MAAESVPSCSPSGAVTPGKVPSSRARSTTSSGGLIDGNPNQVITQLYGIAVVAVYDAIASLIILKLVDLTIGLRVESDIEREGLDLAIHGEAVQ